MAEGNLIGLTVHQARERRWKVVGSKATGHPLAEAYENLADALGFIGEAHRRGFHTIHFEERLYELCDDFHSLVWHELGPDGNQSKDRRHEHDER